MKNLSYALGFMFVGFMGLILGNNIKNRMLVKEVSAEAINISQYFVSTVDNLVRYIQKRFDDLSEEEIQYLSDVTTAIEDIKQHLSHNKHRY